MMLASNLFLTFLALNFISIHPIEGLKTKERERNDYQHKEDLESENKSGRNGKSNHKF
jgi:hypothetical protein